MSCMFVGWQLSEDTVINKQFQVTVINPTDQDFKNIEYDDYHWCNNHYKRPIDCRNKQVRSYSSETAGE